MSENYVLPLVDISKLISPQLEERLQVARELDRACREVGFLYIRGDQLQPALFEQLVQTAQQYFAQEQAKKNAELYWLI